MLNRLNFLQLLLFESNVYVSASTRALTTSYPFRQLQQTTEDSKVSDLQLSDQSTADIETRVRQARQTFGETLPQDFLSLDEYVIYERLYGPPTRATTEEDLEQLEAQNIEYSADDAGLESQNVILRQTDQGDLEEVFVDSSSAERTQQYKGLEGFSPRDRISEQEYIEVEGKTPRQLDALRRLRKDMLDSIGSRVVGGEDDIIAVQEDTFEEAEEGIIYEEAARDGLEEDEGNGGAITRLHALTQAGKFGSQPSSITLPASALTGPVLEMLSNISNKHILETAHNTLGGQGLPLGPSTPKSKRHLARKPIPLRASQGKMTEREADVFMAAIMPGTYAAVMSTLVEIRKRLGTEWLRSLLTKRRRSSRTRCWSWRCWNHCLETANECRVGCHARGGSCHREKCTSWKIDSCHWLSTSSTSFKSTTGRYNFHSSNAGLHSYFRWRIGNRFHSYPAKTL